MINVNWGGKRVWILFASLGVATLGNGASLIRDENSLSKQESHKQADSIDHRDSCIVHTANTEYNFFHMFERNMLAVVGAAQSHWHEHQSSTRAVLFEGCTDAGLLESWTPFLLNASVQCTSSTINSKKSSPPQCNEMIHASSSADWSICPAIRLLAYKRLGLGLHRKNVAGKKIACFFGRSASNKRARIIKNQQELMESIKHLGYESRSVIFDTATPEEAVTQTHDCDVAVGIHGAGLTNFMFMRPNSLAIQLVPHGLSNGFITSYEELSHGSNLQYREWQASMFQSMPHWEQLNSSGDDVKHAVCSYGVDRLKKEGNGGDDFLSWSFWVNQDVEVPVQDFQSLLTNENKRQRNPSMVKLASDVLASGRVSSTSNANGLFAAYVNATRAYVNKILELSKNWTDEQARQFCSKYNSFGPHS